MPIGPGAYSITADGGPEKKAITTGGSVQHYCVATNKCGRQINGMPNQAGIHCIRVIGFVAQVRVLSSQYMIPNRAQFK